MTILVRSIKLFDFLPAYQPWLPQVVCIEKEELSDGRIRIKTNGPEGMNEWIFTQHDSFTMPRHRNNKPKDWRYVDAPFTHQLASGDVLPAPDGTMDNYQLVVELQKRGTLDIKEVTLKTVTIIGHDIHLWRAHADQPVTFPRSELRAIAMTPQQRARLAPHGPYVYGERRYFFRVHPFGRGRWPSYIPEFLLTDEAGHVECRPPSPTTGRQYWDLMDFEGDERHPNDPIRIAKERNERLIPLASDDSEGHSQFEA